MREEKGKKKKTFLSFLGEQNQFPDWQCSGGLSSTPLSLNIQGGEFYKAKQEVEAGNRWWYIWWYPLVPHFYQCLCKSENYSPTLT